MDVMGAGVVGLFGSFRACPGGVWSSSCGHVGASWPSVGGEHSDLAVAFVHTPMCAFVRALLAWLATGLVDVIRVLWIVGATVRIARRHTLGWLCVGAAQPATAFLVARLGV